MKDDSATKSKRTNRDCYLSLGFMANVLGAEERPLWVSKLQTRMVKNLIY